jgi:hypothetical protein
MLDQIEIIEHPGGRVDIRDHRPPIQSCSEELSGEALRRALIDEIEHHVAAIAAEARERPSADNVRRMLYLWTSPDDADEKTLSGVMMQASYVLNAMRQGISTRVAVLSMPKVVPGLR